MSTEDFELASAFIRIDNTDISTAPTFMCSICSRLKDPRVTTCYSYAWICPECSGRLKRLLYGEEEMR